MNVLIIPIGSHGDVHPFLGIAHALRSRGHDVTVIAGGVYEALVRRLGFDYAALGTAEEFLTALRDPDIWHPTRGFSKIAELVAEGTPRVYKAIAERVVPGETALVYSTLAFGARIAQETLGVPGASVHLSPAIFRSLYDTPKYPGLFLPNWLPRWVKRIAFQFGDKHMIDSVLAPPLNAFRATLGLAPVSGILREWVHSPQRVIGLFPAWFGEPQPDWPAHSVLGGFPLYDEKDVTPVPDEARRFLEAGAPPIVFTPGSAMCHGQSFFAAAADACARLGRRGMLLSRHTEHIPRDLPAGVTHVPYAPFSELLPRAAALVHHGGIGTTAQAMKAGIPQLIMPMSHDQPDNANRISRLGIGAAIKPTKFNGANVAAVLGRLLDSPATAENCRNVARRFEDDPDPLNRVAEWIEALLPGAGNALTEPQAVAAKS